MTRPEYSGVRSLEFSQWIRTNLPDSNTGFLVTNLDYILINYKTKQIMFVEEKTNNAPIKKWQQINFDLLARWVSRGVDSDWTFKGFHVVIFENTSPSDGKIYFDGKEINEGDLKTVLSFGGRND